jgi:hypothetical protein
MVVRVRRGTMRRPLALALIVLGLVVTLIGGTGIFAPFTDTATTGVNSLTSGARPRAADIQLAWAVPGYLTCADPGTYAENSTTPGFSALNVQPGYNAFINFCLRNVGTGTTGINVRVIDRIDTETDCTGDESEAGDATCGTGVGELSSVIVGQVYRINCTNGSNLLVTGLGPLGNDPNVNAAGWTMAPDEIFCGTMQVTYLTSTALADVLKAQTDNVTWKYQFVSNVP